MNRIGIMEYWNVGIVGGKAGALALFHNSTAPTLPGKGRIA
jgi:hypothetical protein